MYLEETTGISIVLRDIEGVENRRKFLAMVRSVEDSLTDSVVDLENLKLILAEVFSAGGDEGYKRGALAMARALNETPNE